MASAIVLLTHGFEEMELVAPVDFLRRASVEVTIAGVGLGEDGLATGRNGMVLRADRPLAEVLENDYDAVVIPGGPGHTILRREAPVRALLKRHAYRGAWLAAICAGPTVLLDAGVLGDAPYTAHPSTKDELPKARPEAVVVKQPYITSQGAGTAHLFGLALVEALCGSPAASAIAQSTCVPG